MASYGRPMKSAWTFGTRPDGRDVTAYRIGDAAGLHATVLDYGGILQSLVLPDGTDVTLGYSTLEAYLKGDDYRGAVIGRNANRIVGADFSIDGTRYSLPANEGDNNLHSGPDGLDVQMWDVTRDGRALILPDLQIYTGDALPDPRTGLALEPQFRPNDINVAGESLLRPGEVYAHWVEYAFVAN